MLLTNGDCRFGHFTSHDFGLLVRQLAFTSSAHSTVFFFWKGGTLHCSEQLSNHAPSQFTFGIWKDGRAGIRRPRTLFCRCQVPDRAEGYGLMLTRTWRSCHDSFVLTVPDDGGDVAPLAMQASPASVESLLLHQRKPALKDSHLLASLGDACTSRPSPLLTVAANP